MKRSLSFIYILVFTSTISFCLAQEKKQDPKEYIVGVQELEYMPHYHWDGKDFSGFAKDILEAFSQSVGIKFKYHAVPVLRLANVFLNQEVDFRYPDHENWKKDLKKDHRIFYSNPVVHYVEGVHVLPENKNKKLGELKHFGTLLNFTIWSLQESIKEGKITMDFNPSTEGLIQQALLKRIEGLAENRDVVQYSLETLGKPKALVFNDKIPYDEGDYKLATIKHPKLMEKFNEWMTNNQDFIQKIKKKYKMIY